MKVINVYVDGNLTQEGMAVGIFLIKDVDDNILTTAEFIPEEECSTKRQAAYQAIAKTLQIMVDFGLNSFKGPIRVHVESRAIVKQLSGKYPIKQKSLQEAYEKVIALKQYFKKMEFVPFSGNLTIHIVQMKEDDQRKKLEALARQSGPPAETERSGDGKVENQDGD